MLTAPIAVRQPRLSLHSYITLYMDTVLFLTRSSVIAADVFVLVLTWIKSFKHFREMRQLRLGLSISAVLLRDGMRADFTH